MSNVLKARRKFETFCTCGYELIFKEDINIAKSIADIPKEHILCPHCLQYGTITVKELT